IEQCRHNSRNDDSTVVPTYSLSQNKSTGSHNGRQDLPTSRSHRLNTSGKPRLIASPLHQRNSEHTSANHVCHSRSVNRTHQGGTNHGSFCWASPRSACQGKREIDKELAC